MIDVDKEVDSIAPPSGGTDLIENNEQRFPSHISQTSQMSIIDQDFCVQKFPFRFQFYNQLIKAFSLFYLVFGFIMAISFFIDKTFKTSNDSWNRIGIINFSFILINSVSIISMKILIHRNSHLIKIKHPTNIYLFYIIIVVSAILSFFSLIFFLLKNFDCESSVLADFLLPISRLIFLIIALIFISDLMNYEIECNENRLAIFFFYKFTTMLTFVTFVNTTIFEFLHSLSNSLPGTDNFCNGNGTTFTEMSNLMQKYFNVFSLIFSIVSVFICIEPLKQFYHNYILQPINNENQPLLQNNCHISPRRLRFISKHFSITLFIGGFIFLLVAFIIPIKLLKEHSNITNQDIEIISNSLTIFPYLIGGLIDILLLKLLYEKYHLIRENDLNSTYTRILWTSSFGIVLMVFANIMMNVDKLERKLDGNDLAANIIGLFINLENLVESLLQTMTIDYLLNVNWNCEIKRKYLSQIFNCCVILIAFNIGLFCVNYYDHTGHEIIKPINNPYNNYMWDIITTLITPFSLIYRLLVPLILWKFCSRMKCYELEMEQEN